MPSNIDILETAKSYLGKISYVFGSDDINGGTGDCSSFTEHVFAVHGLTIGADTSAQYTQGLPISRHEIKAGDLVFFKDTYDSGKIDGVSHVGIAINKDTFVHLASNGCEVSSLNNSYYKEHYLGARRVHGVSYDGEVVFETTATEQKETTTETDLKWWGDIVRIVVIVLVVLAMIIFIVIGVGKDIVLDIGAKVVTKKGGLSNE